MKKQFYFTILSVFIFCFTSCTKDEEVLTIPSDASNFIANAGAEEVTFTWTKPTDSDLEEYWLTIDPLVIGAFPIDKSLETYTLKNIKGNVTYTFKLLVKNMSGGISEGVTATATPAEIDRTPPSEVTNLTAEPNDTKIALTWTKPTENDLASYELSYEPGGGTQTLTNDIESYTIEGLINDTEYTITIKTKDEVGNISTGTIVKATPKEGDNTPPAEASDFTFSGDYGNLQFTVGWANPVDVDFSETELTYFYGSEAPVTVSIAKTDNSYIIDGTYSENYTLTIKTKDEAGNYSTGVTKKIRFGNFSVGSQADINSGFDADIVAILAGKLKISGTDATDLSIFSNLEIVEGKFDIVANAGLINLDAFSNMKLIVQRIYIADNANLSDFCGLKNLINAGGAPDSYTVSGNSSNPTKQEILDNCN